MTDNLEQTTSGEYAFAYAAGRGIPWHRLGASIPDGADSAAEICAASRTDWRVGLARVFIHPKQGEPIEVPNVRAIARCSDLRIFGTATPHYEPLQNLDVVESLAAWCEDGRAGFETMGALGNGSRLFATMRIGEDFLLAGKPSEKIHPYALATWGHDGKTAAIVTTCLTRTVCYNTLIRALGEGNQRVYIRHTRSALHRIQDAARALGLVSRRVAEAREKLERLAQLAASQELTERVFTGVVPEPPEDASAEQRQAAQYARLALWRTYQKSPTVALAGTDNRYGVFNAVTEYLDWVEQRKGQNPNSTNADWRARRAEYTFTGDGAARRDAALATLAGAS